MRSPGRIAALLGVAGALVVAGALPAYAETIPLPSLGLEPATTPQEGLQTLQVFLMLTVISIAPAILILSTAFVRIVVVFGFLRNALGTSQLPPNQVLLALALFLTFAVMSPTFKTINETALQPYMNGEIAQAEALETAALPLKEFMLRQTREQDLALMLDITQSPAPEGPEDVSFLTAVPAFAISELKTAFTMGFVIFLPFVVIDFIAASSMMSMGMMMVPPALVAMPFKILLFVLVDGWHLVVKSLFDSFQV
ncbi:MAG TPA: flagellar type III secretion system pore protein FliP [Symbiobacteriaceae bacterium]|nr:flagellar type III secretion system pore protein FliP [Symbiobacteriaceae bacterium]